MSEELEEIAERRQLYVRKSREERIPVILDGGTYYLSCAMPIITEGDMIGCVCSVVSEETDAPMGAPDAEAKLIQTAATFLSKQMES